MNSQFLRLNWKNIVNGLVVAVGGAVVGTIGNTISTGGFDIFTYDWSGIGKIAITAGLAYLIKKFFSTEDGKTFGKIG